jgi:hypothetical protein
MTMADLTAQKTLVKSPPELWSELSEVESLAKHLGELGEIRITKVEPESTVAWEGEEVSGTVDLEQSGWGTKVTFKATVPEPGPAVESEAATEPEPVFEAAEPEPEPTPEPVAVEPEPVESDLDEPVTIEPAAEVTQAESPAEPKQGFFARWLFRRRQPVPEPIAPQEKPPAAPEPVAIEPEPTSVGPEPVEAPVVEPDPVASESEPPAEPAPTPVATTNAERVQRVLDGTLEALGQAHHRPFSRG